MRTRTSVFLFIAAAALILAGCEAGFGPSGSGPGGLRSRALAPSLLDASTEVRAAAAPSHPYLLSGVGEEPVAFKLMAGQHIEMGSVSYSTLVEADASGIFRAYLLARLDTLPDWGLGKVHFGIWTRDRFLALWNPTLDAAGNIVNFRLVPGQFPNHSPELDPLAAKSYEFKIDITDLLPAALDGSVNLYAAIHAEAHRIEGGSVVQSETAWGGGYQNGRGNWAMYQVLGFSYEVVEPPEPSYAINYVGSESAFAFGPPNAVDFRGLGFSRWGWTNLVPYGTNRSMALYAGAGQSDVTKGKPVGTVEVSNANGLLRVAVKLADTDIPFIAPDGSAGVAEDIPFKASAFHLYAGKAMLPVAKTGKTSTPTVAPGQYPAQVAFDPALFLGETAYATSYVKEFPSNGDRYVILHGVVSFPEVVFVAP